MAKSRKAFTIVEVVMVLAVFGLIIVMVFVAFPALRNSQRRVQRQDDLGRIAALATSYRSMHGNSSPFQNADTTKQFVSEYLDQNCVEMSGSASLVRYSSCNDEFSDPDGSAYGFELRGILSGSEGESKEVEATSDDDIESHLIVAYEKAYCANEERLVVVGSGRNDFALVYFDPQTKIAYCYDGR